MLLAKPALAPRFDRLPFSDSCQGRDLAVLRCGALAVATSHLESFVVGTPYTGAPQRKSQLRFALQQLGGGGGGGAPTEALFLGDLNWDDSPSADGPLDRLLAEAKPAGAAPGWKDLWVEANPGNPGLTYDPGRNGNLGKTSKIRRRFDRVLGSLQRLAVKGMRLVGTEPVLDRSTGKALTYSREFSFGPGEPKVYPRTAHPSDHFGIVCDLVRRQDR